MAESATHCPKCDSVEWFPGAACWHCGWEGSAAEAYALLRDRLAKATQWVFENCGEGQEGTRSAMQSFLKFLDLNDG